MTQYDDDGYEEDDVEGYEDDPNVQRIDPPDPQPVAEPKARRETVIPIGEAVTAETLHGVVAYTRSLNLGSRDNNSHYRCEMPFVVQPGWTADQCAAQAADAFYQCVAVVLGQAGLPFAVGEDGVLHEVIKNFPGARRVDQAEGDRRPQRRPEGGGGGGQFPHPADMRRPEHIRQDDWDDLANNYDDWYDNRSDKDTGQYPASSPDFKRKDDGKGLWLTPFRREGGGNRGGDRHARSGGGGRQYRD